MPAGPGLKDWSVSMSTPIAQDARVVIAAENLQRRMYELARQISADYQGQNIHAVCVLENGFMFMSDLVRLLDVPVICQFVKPVLKEQPVGSGTRIEIFFTPEVEVRGGHVLLVEGLLHSGVTSEFLMRNLMGRGAASVKLATLLDRQSGRRVLVQPDYFGFLIDDSFVFGYGLGAPHLGRNLPFISAVVVSSVGSGIGVPSRAN